MRLFRRHITGGRLALPRGDRRHQGSDPCRARLRCKAIERSAGVDATLLRHTTALANDSGGTTPEKWHLRRLGRTRQRGRSPRLACGRSPLVEGMSTNDRLTALSTRRDDVHGRLQQLLEACQIGLGLRRHPLLLR